MLSFGCKFYFYRIIFWNIEKKLLNFLIDYTVFVWASTKIIIKNLFFLQFAVSAVHKTTKT